MRTMWPILAIFFAICFIYQFIEDYIVITAPKVECTQVKKECALYGLDNSVWQRIVSGPAGTPGCTYSCYNLNEKEQVCAACCPMDRLP